MRLSDDSSEVSFLDNVNASVKIRRRNVTAM